ncbi:hypothetical protein [uncultured Marixanthomonas sp.]|uniref:hypothetical protein n=1 Tax=uncultured Marixanthomonas sp. TaxID=757245 RepID=UPI0030D9E7E7|tara:strand:+ start:53331 stop:54758 length:1428 start_codon:yes stop_codon:yes gene_type:complete
MNNLNKILESVVKLEGSKCIVVDDFNKATFSLNIVNKSPISDFNKLEEFLNSYKDDWTFFLLLNGETISSCNSKFTTDFIKEFNQIQLLEDDLLGLKLEIYKSSNTATVNVYNNDSFENWLNSRTTIELLNTLSNRIIDFGFINFNYIDKSSAHIFSKRIRVNDSNAVTDLPKTHLEHFNFNQNTKYPFIGTDFKILNASNYGEILIIHLRKLQNLFSFTALFDTSYLDKNILNFQLKGYKFLKSQIDVSNLNKDYDTYADITAWVYSENANIADKLGITRNILSLEIDNENLVISDKVFQSILSAHKIYLKENVAKYLEVRAKVNNDLTDILQEIRSSLQELSQNYQKSNFLYLSFFISVFVLRTLMKSEFENIFTTDATIIFFALLGISFIYLAYTVWVVVSLKNRVEKRYENVKAKNLDVLNKNDIERILNNDSEFDDEIANFNLKVKIYIILWVLTMGTLAIAVSYLSEVY